VSFTFEFVLGGDVVKTVAFPTQQGARTLRSSGGQKIGKIVVMRNKVRLELDEFAAKTIADAQFH
jgi:uncharacterized membrane protein